jgi:hypothetical protein
LETIENELEAWQLVVPIGPLVHWSDAVRP